MRLMITHRLIVGTLSTAVKSTILLSSPVNGVLGWSEGAMVLGELPVLGHSTNLDCS